MFGLRTIKTILKLKKFFMLGYCPDRKGESYSFVNPYSKMNYYKHINCFAHACFNLTNQQITENCLEQIDTDSFKFLIEDYWETDQSIFNRLASFIKKTGLKIEKCTDDEGLEDNQWRVALYFCNGYFFRDFHFLLNEKDGSWSGKYGTEDVLEFFDKRPEEYVSEKFKDVYKYYGSYKITNPFAGKDKIELSERELNIIAKNKKFCRQKLEKKQISVEENNFVDVI